MHAANANEVKIRPIKTDYSKLFNLKTDGANAKTSRSNSTDPQVSRKFKNSRKI